jgi:hypothetical protein
MSAKLIAILLLSSLFSFFLTGCGKTDEEKKNEAAAAFGYGTKPDSYPEPSHSKF